MNIESIIQNYRDSTSRFIIDFIFIFCITCLVFPLLLLMLKKTGGTNSYAALAEAFLNSRLDVDKCFDIDCVTSSNGWHWIISPPDPAILIMPFVAIFGAGFSGLHFISLTLGITTAIIWKRNFIKLELSDEVAHWVVAAVVFATPLIMVIYRANLV